MVISFSDQTARLGAQVEACASMVQDGIQASEVADQSLLSTDCEQVWVSIKLEDDEPLLVGCVYRPPRSNEDELSNSDIAIARSLDAAARLLRCKLFSSVVVMGDFNLPDVEWSENGSPVLANVSSPSLTISDAISSTSFVQLVNCNTFFNSGQSSSLLDLVPSKRLRTGSLRWR